MSVESQVAVYVSTLRYADIDDATRAAFGRMLLDTLAVSIAGFRDPTCRSVAGVLSEWNQDGTASVVGSQERASPPAAAFANGVYAHWCEWDDSHDPSHVHASAVIFPALLAALEASGQSQIALRGEEFMVATIAAFDVSCRVGKLLKPFIHRGWMPTGTGGAVGAAAGAARILGLDASGIQSAMGIAAAGSGLSRQALADLVNAKNILAGVAAKIGVESALLARAGVSGAPNFITGDYGLQALYAEGRGDAMQLLDGLGQDFSISEVSVKPYPCCRSAHPALDIVFDLLRDQPSIVNEIVSLKIEVPHGVYERVGRPFEVDDNPRMAALFSVPYSVAIALRKGVVAPEDFNSQFVREFFCDFKELIGKIVVEAVPVPNESADPIIPTRAVFTLSDGEEIERTAITVKGAPDHAMTADEEARKVVIAVGDSLPPEDIGSLIASARGIPFGGLVGILDHIRRPEA
jgi:2-methylcitrate dehydratase PrpD